MQIQLNASTSRRRAGISLMEVLISIGVITFGIFGVASLIPVAQFKVAEGTARDRQAGFGPSAVATFRIHNMGSPNNWLIKSSQVGDFYSKAVGPNADQLDPLGYDGPVSAWKIPAPAHLRRRPFCIDPLGVIENGYSDAVNTFPWNANATFAIPRLSLNSLAYDNAAIDLPLARELFLLKDDLEFDRPEDQQKQPRRQYVVDSLGTKQAITEFASGSLSWFATLSPASVSRLTDEFMLSVVIVQNRVPLLITEEENWATVNCEYAGEITIQTTTAGVPNQINVAELRTGDWLLLSKQIVGGDNPATKRVCRWTQITGSTDEKDATADAVRAFTIANDDFFHPGMSANEVPTVTFVRGVKAVYERTIRLENAEGSWN